VARRRRPEIVQNQDRWLISYADFISLLFAFFVVMYATSAGKVGSLVSLSESIVRAFGLPIQAVDPEGAGASRGHLLPQGILGEDRVAVGFQIPLRAATNAEQLEIESGAASKGDAKAAEEIAQVRGVLQTAIGELLTADGLALSSNDKWVTIEIPARMLFPSGSRSLLASSIPMLSQLADTLSKLPNELIVQGHTDNQPIRNGQFPSNWELSSTRASAIARFFEEEGIEPTRLRAVGYGANRPIADNDTEEGRAENRRVVVQVRSALLSEVVRDG